MARDRVRKADDNNDDESTEENGQKAPSRDYMRTWGSTVQFKQEFADKAAEEHEALTDEERAEIEAERPGVNPVVSPDLNADGTPAHE